MKSPLIHLSAIVLLVSFSVSSIAKGAGAMTAKGTFTVQMKPQEDAPTADGVSLGRMLMDKVYEGDLAGTAEGQMLTAMTPVKDSAGYVAIERVTGTLHGKKGSFALQHTGTMNHGEQTLSITIVPDSGTGELAGIAGVFRLKIEGGKHYYELEYSLKQP